MKQHGHREAGHREGSVAAVGQGHLVQEDAAPRLQGLEGPARQARAGGGIPVVEDVAEEDGVVAGRPRIPEHVGGAGDHAVVQSVAGDVLRGDGADLRQIEEGAAHRGMDRGDRRRQRARAGAHIEEPAHLGEDRLPRQAGGGGQGEGVHAADELAHLRRREGRHGHGEGRRRFPGAEGGAQLLQGRVVLRTEAAAEGAGRQQVGAPEVGQGKAAIAGVTGEPEGGDDGDHGLGGPGRHLQGGGHLRDGAPLLQQQLAQTGLLGQGRHGRGEALVLQVVEGAVAHRRRRGEGPGHAQNLAPRGVSSQVGGPGTDPGGARMRPLKGSRAAWAWQSPPRIGRLR